MMKKKKYNGTLLSQEISEKQRAQRLKEDLELLILAAIIVAPLFAHLIELVVERLKKLF